MSTPLEHDYIGLGESPTSMEKSCDKISSSVSSNLCSEDENTSFLNFKETELRLGLPGSDCDSPQNNKIIFGKDLKKNNHNNGYSVSSTPSKNLKRGFSDAISASSSSGKWIFSVSDDATEPDLENGSNASARCNKEVDMVLLAQFEKQDQIADMNDHATAPAAK